MLDRTFVAQLAQKAPHHRDRGEDGEVRINRQLEAQLREFVLVQKRRLAAGRHVEQRAHLERLGYRREVFHGERGFDKNHVRARGFVRPPAIQRRVEAFDGERIGARDDDEIVVAARVTGRLDFVAHLGRRHQRFAAQVAAALGRLLVFEVDAGDTGFFIGDHCALHIQRVAIAGVGIRNYRQPAGVDDASGVVDHFRQREQTDIRHAETHRRGAAAGHVNRIETLRRDHARIQRIGHTGGDHHAGGCE